MLTWVGELRYAIRLLLRSPGFTLVAVAALALGIGANLTIFGFVNALLLRPLPALEPDRLIRADSGGAGFLEWYVHYDDYLEYRDRNQSLSDLAMFSMGGMLAVRLEDGPPETIHVMPVTGNYFEILGVPAAMGRAIAPEDDESGAARVVMLSDVGWRRHFEGDPAVVGRTLTIEKTPYTIIGVAPADFTGTTSPVIPRLYVPWSARDFVGQSDLPGRRRGYLIGRLKPGVSRSEAQADLSRIAAQIAEQENRRTSLTVYPATTPMPGFVKMMTGAAALFMIMVAVVLAVACDNVALLQLARSAARRREMGIRLALGASRLQLIRQILVESFLLALLGGLGAVAIALVTSTWLTQIYLPVPMPIALTFDFDGHVLVFAIGISLTATLLCGLGPVVRSWRTDVVSSLKEGGLAASTSGSRWRSSSSMVVIQVASSTMLLVTSGLLVRSLSTPQQRGLVADRVLMATVRFPKSDYTDREGLAFCEKLVEHTEGSPGIVSVNVVDNVPLTSNSPLSPTDMHAENAGAPSDRENGARRVYTNRVSGGHFRTLGIPLLEGRDFTALDDVGSPAVGIVNETLARRFWPGESPIGKRLGAAAGPWIEVVGLGRDSKYESIQEVPKALLYRPLAQQPVATVTFLIKTEGDPRAATSVVRARVAELDPNLPVYNLNTLEERIGLNLFPNRALALVSSILGLFALALGTMGIYGLMSYLVEQRRREIGVRLALGASSSRVVNLITRQGMTWTVTGVVLGLTLALVFIRFLQGRLYGLSATDPIAIGGVLALLIATAYAACALPAKRASRTAPLAVLRE